MVSNICTTASLKWYKIQQGLIVKLLLLIVLVSGGISISMVFWTVNILYTKCNCCPVVYINDWDSQLTANLSPSGWHSQLWQDGVRWGLWGEASSGCGARTDPLQSLLLLSWRPLRLTATSPSKREGMYSHGLIFCCLSGMMGTLENNGVYKWEVIVRTVRL